MALAARTNREGFTVAEILLALVLLSFVIMGFQAATGQIIHHSSQSDRRLVAVQLADDRLTTIRLDPDYETLKARYEGVESQLAGYDGLQRSTVIARTLEVQATGLLDYQRITVTVSGNSLEAPVARTIVLAAP